MIKYNFSDPKLNERAAVSWHQVRRLGTLMKDDLRDRGLWNDLSQEIYTSAWESHKLNRNIRETSNAAQRAIHHFLSGFGIKRKKHSKNYTPCEFLLRDEEGDY